MGVLGLKVLVGGLIGEGFGGKGDVVYGVGFLIDGLEGSEGKERRRRKSIVVSIDG